MRSWALAVVVGVACLAPVAWSAEVTHTALRDELLAMRERDQKYRMPGQADHERQSTLDLANQKRLRHIIGQYGFPTLPMVGRDGVQAAWLVVQHADNDRALQSQVLSLLAPLAARGLVPSQEVAYLHDRIHHPQRYGTQGTCVAPGQWAPRELESPGDVDTFRKDAGLGPLDEYIQLASSHLCPRK